MTNYTAGRAQEYAARDELIRRGFEAARSAGSHGKADLIAWNEHILYLIQLKSTRRRGQLVPRQVIEDALLELNAIPQPQIARVQCWTHVYRQHGFTVYQLAEVKGEPCVVEIV